MSNLKGTFQDASGNNLMPIPSDSAPIETSSTASQSYAVNDYFYYNNTLYKCTVPIAQGGTITPGTNCTATTTGGELSQLNSRLTTIEEEGLVNTKCKIKEVVWWISSIPNGNSGFVNYLDNDGNYTAQIPGYSSVDTDYANYLSQVDFIRSATVTSSSYYAAYYTLVLDKDGFYMRFDNNYEHAIVRFYSAGTTLTISPGSVNMPMAIMYLGVSAP